MPDTPKQDTPKSAPEPFRNRIIGAEEVAPDQLLANPSNWRIHSREQKEALAAVLDRVGWVQDVIVNMRTGHVVDGHARIMVALQRGEPTVPVKYVDLSDEEEKIVLATLDPIAAMASTDAALLRDLMEQVTTEGEAVRAILDDIAEHEQLALPGMSAPEKFQEVDDDLETDHECPKCGYRWSGKAGTAAAGGA